MYLLNKQYSKSLSVFVDHKNTRVVFQNIIIYGQSIKLARTRELSWWSNNPVSMCTAEWNAQHWDSKMLLWRSAAVDERSTPHLGIRLAKYIHNKQNQSICLAVLVSELFGKYCCFEKWHIPYIFNLKLHKVQRK